jgi:5-oxoprolinase (ATP-hydrolysing) subunit A
MVGMDLNADVGESFGRWSLGDDSAMLHLVTSANVACGFHAGDPAGIMATCKLAMQSNVVVGAQVGYRDLAGFGRRFMDLSGPDLKADVIYQIGALQALARAVGTSVRYVKPHGALYHAVNRHEEQARALISAVLTNDEELAVVGPPGSLFLSLAHGAGLRTVREGFADRGYGADGQLLPREAPGALLTDAGTVATQAARLAQSGEYDTLCLHSDTPGSVTLAQAARRSLAAARVSIAPFIR